MAASPKPAPTSTLPGTKQVFHFGQTDHLYLAPSFYHSINDLNNHLEKSATSQANGKIIVQRSLTNGTIIVDNKKVVTVLNDQHKLIPVSATGFHQLTREESLSSCSDIWTVEQEELLPPNGHHLGGQSGAITNKGHFDYDEFDEDSNDTRSCSSSSGCSSSSNSMVGSVNRHLSLNNSQYHRTPISTTTSSSGKNGTVITSSAVSQYKDLTPKQVSAPHSFHSLYFYLNWMIYVGIIFL